MWQEIIMTAIFNGLAKILQVVLDAIIRIIESLFGGITNLLVKFVSSQFGVGVLTVLGGYLLFIKGEDIAPWVGLVGFFIIGTSFRKKKKRKN